LYNDRKDRIEEISRSIEIVNFEERENMIKYGIRFRDLMELKIFLRGKEMLDFDSILCCT